MAHVYFLYSAKETGRESERERVKKNRKRRATTKERRRGYGEYVRALPHSKDRAHLQTALIHRETKTYTGIISGAEDRAPARRGGVHLPLISIHLTAADTRARAVRYVALRCVTLCCVVLRYVTLR